MMMCCLLCRWVCRCAKEWPWRGWAFCSWTGSCKAEWLVIPQMLNAAIPVVPVSRHESCRRWANALMRNYLLVPAVPQMIIRSGSSTSPSIMDLWWLHTMLYASCCSAVRFCKFTEGNWFCGRVCCSCAVLFWVVIQRGDSCTISAGKQLVAALQSTLDPPWSSLWNLWYIWQSNIYSCWQCSGLVVSGSSVTDSLSSK